MNPITVLDLIYDDPYYAFVGTPIANKDGHIYSRLKGNVRSASSFYYRIEDGRKFYYRQSCYVYDEQGQLRHTEASDRDGVLSQCTNYFYDDNDRCVVLIAFDSKGVWTERYVFKYNENNLLSTSEWFDEKGSCGQKVYVYDERGFIIEERWDSRSQEHKWKRLYKNNEHGNWIELREYKGQYGSSDYWYAGKNIKKYDENDRLIEHIFVDNSGKEIKLSIDEYDEKGRCIKMSNSKFIITYDTHNRFKEARNSKGDLAIRVLYNDDTSLQIMWFCKEGQIIEKRRDVFFDNHGNVNKILDYEGENLDLVQDAVFYYEYYPE